MFCNSDGFEERKCLVVLGVGLGWVVYHHIVIG